MKPVAIQFLANTPKETGRFGIIRHSSLRMFFNGTLCEVQITDNPDWWTGEGVKGMYNYQIWDTHSCLDSQGTGMKDVYQINAEVLYIITDMGVFRVRSINETDFRVYGVNNFKGIYIEPVHIDFSLCIKGEIDYDSL